MLAFRAYKFGGTLLAVQRASVAGMVSAVQEVSLLANKASLLIVARIAMIEARGTAIVRNCEKIACLARGAH